MVDVIAMNQSYQFDGGRFKSTAAGKVANCFGLELSNLINEFDLTSSSLNFSSLCSAIVRTFLINFFLIDRLVQLLYFH